MCFRTIFNRLFDFSRLRIGLLPFAVIITTLCGNYLVFEELLNFWTVTELFSLSFFSFLFVSKRFWSKKFKVKNSLLAKTHTKTKITRQATLCPVFFKTNPSLVYFCHLIFRTFIVLNKLYQDDFCFTICFCIF